MKIGLVLHQSLIRVGQLGIAFDALVQITRADFMKSLGGAGGQIDWRRRPRPQWYLPLWALPLETN